MTIDFDEFKEAVNEYRRVRGLTALQDNQIESCIAVLEEFSEKWSEKK